MNRRIVTTLIATTLVAAACSAGSEATSPTTADPAPAPTTTTTIQPQAPNTTATEVEAAPPATDEDPGAGLSPLAARVTELDSALYDETEHVDTTPEPVSISIESLDIAAAAVVDVGVEPNGDMEIPSTDAVGWYRFNPKPGQEGSSVLAAHISYNGSPGVFRYLSDASVGDQVVIGYADGSTAAFEIVELAQYDKQELPFDRIFAKDGQPVLTLITCGGDFNRAVSSYEDNFVAYAVPLDG